MNYEALEAGVVSLLTAAMPSGDVTIKALPELEEEITRSPGRKSRIDVAIAGDESTGHKSVMSVIQTVKVRIEVMIKSSRLRGDYGIYDLRRRIAKALVGKRIASPPSPNSGDYGGLDYIQFQMNAYSDGVFSYSMFFETCAAVFEDYIEVAPGTPLITSVDFDKNI